MGCFPPHVNQFLCFALFLLNFQATLSYSSYNKTQICSPKDSMALIQFKNSFSITKMPTNHCIKHTRYPYPKTNSWKEGTDCCLWDGVTCDHKTSQDYGVTCDHKTSQVLGLDLNCSWLRGTIHSNSSLFHLLHLQKLNLAHNDFQNSIISSKFGLFTSMLYLNLSTSNFTGQVPSQISHLSKLVSLYLSWNNHQSLDKYTFDRLVRNLTKIRELLLVNINLSSVHLVSLMNLSSSVTSLSLGGCDLQGKFPTPIFHLPNLKLLHLKGNKNLIVSLPKFNWSSPLEFLNLWLPYTIGNLKALKHLQLGGCNFSGTIPKSLGNLSELIYLELSGNHFRGPIPSSLVNLTKIQKLFLYDNQLEDSIPSQVSLFSTLVDIDFGYNLLNGTLPPWFYSIPSLKYIVIPNNRLTSHIHEFQYKSLKWIEWANNNLQGPIPQSMFELVNLAFLDFSFNNLTGILESKTFLKLKHLKWLDLSHNELSGKIPQYVGTFKKISVLNLGWNHFHGKIPQTFGKSCGLKTINLNENQLEGSIPQSLMNCKKLELLDLANNKLNDMFPSWLETLPVLQVLILRSNDFHGFISNPKKNHSFRELRILDLSNNHFWGAIPIGYIKTFNALKYCNGNLGPVRYMQEGDGTLYYPYFVNLTMKAMQVELKISTILARVDLSHNKFEGEIPEVIGELVSLRGLNLSHNNLGGHIPPSMGNLLNLKWLDLSSNKLNGEIPKELQYLTFLSFLNLSHNQLEGPIPSGKQFNTFENDSYEGNLGLCGFPMSKGCSSEKQRPSSNAFQGDSRQLTDDFGWKVVLVGYACGVPFGLVIGYVVFKLGKPKWFVRMVEGTNNAKWSKKRASKRK